MKFWEKLSHKNGIKMHFQHNGTWTKSFKNCGSFDQNCGVFYEKNLGLFLALFGSGSGGFQFKTLNHFDLLHIYQDAVYLLVFFHQIFNMLSSEIRICIDKE